MLGDNMQDLYLLALSTKLSSEKKDGLGLPSLSNASSGSWMNFSINSWQRIDLLMYFS